MSGIGFVIATVLISFFAFGAGAQTVWHDPLQSDPAPICGRAWNKESGKSFARVPERLLPGLPKSVAGLSRNSAGLTVRFHTDSPNIRIRYTLSASGGYVNMAKLNHSGIDLYAREGSGKWHWIGNHMAWHFGDTITYAYRNIKPRRDETKGLDFELYLPPYASVSSLQVGTDEGSSFRFIPESGEKPVVVYGSSIVQGASPSRPGLMWTSIMKRDLSLPVVNLGFSGSAYMEPPVFKMLGEIDARAFVLDPMPNSYSLPEDEIVKRLTEGVEYLRSKSSVPILLVECPGAADSYFRFDVNDNYERGNRAMRRAYESLEKRGVRNLYYLSKKEIGMDEDCYIEGTHPNDIGNRRQAEAVTAKLRPRL